MDDQSWMKLAIEKTKEGIARGQTPFGACIVQDGELVICAHNAVWENTDVTAHAEISAIRQACAKLGTIDLAGCVIYSTCEPCPMCFAAIHWARIGRIVYGASIGDAQHAGFNELPVSNEQLKHLGSSGIDLNGGLLREQCAGLFAEWLAARGRAY